MPLWPDGEDTALTTVVTFLSIAHTHLGKNVQEGLLSAGLCGSGAGVGEQLGRPGSGFPSPLKGLWSLTASLDLEGAEENLLALARCHGPGLGCQIGSCFHLITEVACVGCLK